MLVRGPQGMVHVALQVDGQRAVLARAFHVSVRPSLSLLQTSEWFPAFGQESLRYGMEPYRTTSVSLGGSAVWEDADDGKRYVAAASYVHMYLQHL